MYISKPCLSCSQETAHETQFCCEACFVEWQEAGPRQKYVCRVCNRYIHQSKADGCCSFCSGQIKVILLRDSNKAILNSFLVDIDTIVDNEKNNEIMDAGLKICVIHPISSSKEVMTRIIDKHLGAR